MLYIKEEDYQKIKKKMNKQDDRFSKEEILQNITNFDIEKLFKDRVKESDMFTYSEAIKILKDTKIFEKCYLLGLADGANALDKIILGGNILWKK